MIWAVVQWFKEESISVVGDKDIVGGDKGVQEGDVVTVLTWNAGRRAQMFKATVLKSFGKCLIELNKNKCLPVMLLN